MSSLSTNFKPGDVVLYLGLKNSEEKKPNCTKLQEGTKYKILSVFQTESDYKGTVYYLRLKGVKARLQLLNKNYALQAEPVFSTEEHNFKVVIRGL